ncbi:hypothetical protein AB1Y20_014358 [Prymnesium parvum]|uniref:Uncharacterized protein n=1 Tax=Prymnesium parvum TaxID=97485 RepID=A0AB34IG09_PRYPA
MDFTQALGILQSRATPPADASRRCVDCSEEAGAATLPPSPPLPSLASLRLPDLLRQLLERQEERVATYRYFDSGFAAFLACAEAEGYEALAASATTRFASVSAAINAVGAQLDAAGGGALAALVRQLQGLEKRKLTLTARSHLLRHGLAVDELRARAAEERGETVPEKEGRASRMRAEEEEEVCDELRQVVEEVNEVLDEVRGELAEMEEEQ